MAVRGSQKRTVRSQERNRRRWHLRRERECVRDDGWRGRSEKWTDWLRSNGGTLDIAPSHPVVSAKRMNLLRVDSESSFESINGQQRTRLSLTHLYSLGDASGHPPYASDASEKVVERTAPPIRSNFVFSSRLAAMSYSLAVRTTIVGGLREG